jgi:sugar phosphate isomerase/epimerase
LRVGFNGRFFESNWRPPADEVRFAEAHGFDAIQVRVDPPATIEDVLRDTPPPTELEWVVELLWRASLGLTVADAVRANLPALHALGARRVHVHPVPGAREIDARELEAALPEQFADAVELAEREGLILGVEHNARPHRLLIEPEACARLLDAVPGLGFVWDVNHTEPEQVAGYAALKPRLSLVHASDTPLPETNHHLPLGDGNLDFSPIADVDVPVILEIGGQPVSGGYGKDTEAALLGSLAILRESGGTLALSRKRLPGS